MSLFGSGLHYSTVNHIEKYMHLVDIDYIRGDVLNFTTHYRNGYEYFRLKGRVVALHNVIMAKLGHDLNGKVVNHINGYRYDNRVKNLEVVTQQENILHARGSHLSSKDIDDIRRIVKTGEFDFDELTLRYRIHFRVFNEKIMNYYE